jgi:peroxiredoxin
LRAAGIQIVGISYDPVDVLNEFSDTEDIPFPLLSDEGSRTIRAYGLHFKGGLPHPATLLVDANGVIRGKLLKEGYVARHTCDELLAAAEQID